MNGIAGILNIVTICKWFNIFISKDRSKDMIWPDMIWAWIIAYDLWKLSPHTLQLHLRPFTIAAWRCCSHAPSPRSSSSAAHGRSTAPRRAGALIMFVMTVPQFADVLAPIPTTHNPTAFLRREPVAWHRTWLWRPISSIACARKLESAEGSDRCRQ